MGGNVFKTADDKALTQRISTTDVRSTVDWIESITGYTFSNEDLLGTTGKKIDPTGSFETNSSGDIDLNTDTNKIPKEYLIEKLKIWCYSQGFQESDIMNKGRKFRAGWIAVSGLQVHFRTPINGDTAMGFVQTDFMLTDNPLLQKGAKRGGSLNYTGTERAILLASIARGRGYKFSPTKGVVDPTLGDAVVCDNWLDIAHLLLGKHAVEQDTYTVESIIMSIKSDTEFEVLVAQWLADMEKVGKGLPEFILERNML